MKRYVIGFVAGAILALAGVAVGQTVVATSTLKISCLSNGSLSYQPQ